MFPDNPIELKNYFVAQKLKRVQEKWGFLLGRSAFHNALYRRIASPKRMERFATCYLEGKKADWALLPNMPQGSLLDVGADIPLDAFWLSRIPAVNRIVMVDLKSAKFAAVPKTHQTCSFAQRLPFPDNSFDLVMSFSAIEHLTSREGQKAWVREMTRVAKVNALVAVTVDNSWSILNGFFLHRIFPSKVMLPISWGQLKDMITKSGDVEIEHAASSRLYQFTSWWRPWAESSISYFLERILTPLNGKLPFLDARIGFCYRKKGH